MLLLSLYKMYDAAGLHSALLYILKRLKTLFQVPNCNSQHFKNL